MQRLTDDEEAEAEVLGALAVAVDHGADHLERAAGERDRGAEDRGRRRGASAVPALLGEGRGLLVAATERDGWGSG